MTTYETGLSLEIPAPTITKPSVRQVPLPVDGSRVCNCATRVVREKSCAMHFGAAVKTIRS